MPQFSLGWVKIYAVLDPETNRPRYVGVTSYKRLSSRLAPMIATCRNNPTGKVGPWINGLTSRGLKPTMLLLEETTDRSRENYWITRLREQGEDLLNVQPGGPGSPGPKSDTVKKKISDTLKGRPLTEDRKRNVREATKLAMSRPDVRARYLLGRHNIVEPNEESRQ